MRDLKIPAQRHPEKARKPDNAQPKKPDWIRVKAPGGKGYADTARIMRDNKLTTVCEEAGSKCGRMLVSGSCDHDDHG